MKTRHDRLSKRRLHGLLAQTSSVLALASVCALIAPDLAMAQQFVTNGGPAPTATGTDASAGGAGASASGNYSVAVGNNASAGIATANDPNGQTNNGGIAIGSNATAGDAAAGSTIAIGSYATATAPGGNGDSMAIGYHAIATGLDSTAFGAETSATATNTIAIGNNGTSAAGAESTVIGIASTASNAATQSVLLGNNSSVNGAGQTVLGEGASASAAAVGGVALGQGSMALRGSINGPEAFSQTVINSTEGAVSVGAVGAERQITNVAGGTQATDAVNVRQLSAVGSNLAGSLGGGAAFNPTTGAYTAPTYTVAGTNYNDVGAAITALGAGSGATFVSNNASAAAAPVATGANSSAGGYGASATGPGSTVVGNGATDNGQTGTVAVGNGATAGSNNSVAIGHGASTMAGGGVAAVAIGNAAVAQGDGAVSLGLISNANGTGATAGGNRSSATGDSAVAFGDLATAVGTSSTSLGVGSKATGESAFAAGTGATANGANAFAMGTGSSASQDGTIAFGEGAASSAGNAVSVGAGASSTVANGVALGAGSAATRAGLAGAAEAFSQTTVASTQGAVSVGDAGAERQITNVAGGTQATDAVNVRQLQSVGSNLAGSLGGGAAFDPTTGAYTAPSFTTAAGTTANTVQAALGNETAAITSLGNGTASKLGGGVSYNPTTGLLTNGFTVNGTTYNDVASAVSGVAANDGLVQRTGTAGQVAVTAPGGTGAAPGAAQVVTNVADGQVAAGSTQAVNGGQLFTTNQTIAALTNGTAGLVQQAGPGAPITVGANTDGTTVAFANNAGTARTLTGVAAGQVAAGSTQAVNGGQLAGTAGSIATALGGGSIVNPDGTISQPGYTVGGQTYNNVGGAIGALTGGSTTAGVKYFHANSTGPDSSATGTDAVAIGSGSTSTQAGGVAIGLGSTANRAGLAGMPEAFSGTNVASTQGAVSVGAVGAERQITNVAGGTQATDAVNVRQLQSVGSNLAGSLGGGAAFDPTTGAYTAPSFTTAAGTTATTVQAALGNETAAITSLGNGTASRLGGGVTYNPTTGLLANGFTVNGTTYGDVASAVSGVAANDGIVQRTGTAGQVAVTAPGGTGAAPGAAQILTNVAAGQIATGSTQAVNGGQLYGTAASVASGLGGNSTVNPDGTVSAPAYMVGGQTYGNVGAALAAGNNLAVQYTPGLMGMPTNAIDLTKGGTLAPVAVTGLANATTSTGAVALGQMPLQYSTAGAPTTANPAVPSGDVTLVGSMAGTPVSLHNLAAGTLSATSTDAVNGGQLYGVSNSVDALGTTTAAAIGGNAAYTQGVGINGLSYSLNGAATPFTSIVAGEQALANGAAGPVQYAVPGTPSNALKLVGTGGPVTLGNVGTGNLSATSTDAVNGSQLYATDQAVASIVAGGSGLVQQNQTTRAISVGAMTDGTTVGFADMNNRARTLTGVAAGQVATGSTQAVNGGQLYGTAGSVATALGGNSAVNPDGTISSPIYNVANGSYTDVGSALTALNNGIASGQLGGFASNNAAGAAAPSATGADSTAGGFGAAATGTRSTALGNGARDNGVANSTVVGNGASVASGATGSNVALGQGTTASRGAQTNYQAYGLAAPQTSAGEVAIGSTAAPRQLTGVAAGSAANDAVNVAQLEGATGALGSSVASGLGGGSTFNPATGQVSAPSYSLANGTVTATNVGAALTNLDGRTTSNTNAIAGLQNGTSGIVQQNSTTRAITVGAGTDGTSVGFANNAGNARTLTGVAAGQIATGSTQAVNGGQLYGTAGSVVAALGGGSAVHADGTISAPSYSVGGQSYGNVGGAITALDSSGVKYDTVAGTGARAQSITLAGGDPNQPVVIHNVAAGTARTDASNFGQVQDAEARANQYTNQQVGGLQNQVAGVNNRLSGLEAGVAETRQEARSAAAIGLAAASLRYDDRPGKFSLAAGGGYWRGEAAAAFGVGYTLPDGRFRLNATAATAGSNVGVGAGATYTLN